MTLKAVLFDLDNTLLLIDSEEEFFAHYLKLVANHFCDLASERQFCEKLMEATNAMIADCSESSNKQVFANHFQRLFPVDANECWQRFIQFYETRFGELKWHCRPAPGNDEVVASAQHSGLKVVVATNPMFPEVAIKRRIDWAGLGDVSFDLITTIETMHACKPQPQYYLEICDRLGVEPQDCLMVGNDTVDDMAAKRTGMMTYLVEHGTWHNKTGMEPDYRGSLIGAARLWTAEKISQCSG